MACFSWIHFAAGRFVVDNRNGDVEMSPEATIYASLSNLKSSGKGPVSIETSQMGEDPFRVAS